MIKNKITVGIVGLGLIGGSFAKALAAAGYDRILALDTNVTTLHYACMTGVVSDTLTPDNIGECGAVILALYPGAAADFLREWAPHIAPGTLVIDTAGTKRMICEAGFSLAASHGFVFVGGHPMAGTQFSGYGHARADLFAGADMILVPKKNEDLHVLSAVKALMTDCGFKGVVLASPEAHDEMIAFTSQLAHVVSNAYIKSPRAAYHRGFSAGSYRDLTRVARLNEGMWTELFLENSDNLLTELNTLIDNLTQYRDALADGDGGRLCDLLREGREIKERMLTDEEDTGKDRA